MPTTLVVEKSDLLQNFYSINLLTWVGSQAIAYPNANKAISQLKQYPNNYDLIVCRDKIGKEKSAADIINFLLDNKVKIPIIVVGETQQTGDQITSIDSALDIKTLIKSSADSLGITAKMMAALEVPDYFAIPINFFNYLKYSITDVYVQETDEDEIKLKFKAEKEFKNTAVRELVACGVSQLFVKKEDRLKFVTNLTQELVSELELKELNQNEQIKAMEMGHQLLHEKLKLLGITDDTVRLANKNLKDMVQTTKKTPALMRLLKRLLDNKAGFHFKHGQILMFIASHLMDHIDWGNEEQKEKLQFIAFFHDIALENDEQARIHTEKELKESSLPTKKKELVKKHAQIASTLVSQYPKAPMGAEQIIRQHHGITHGIGFAETFTANLSPMTIVFVLAEDFATEVIDSAGEFKIKEKIYKMRKKYSTKRFEKIIDILEEITLK